MKHNIFSLLLMALCAASCSPSPASGDSLTRYVDVKIGSGGHGHVFVGAGVPFGMVQLGPTSIPQSWDWCSGYHAGDSSVIGFSHTHLEGTGIGDLFDVTVMPVTGKVAFGRGTVENPEAGQGSLADRSREIARPGYYSVPLERYGITAEMTATERTGFHRYTFPATDSAALVFDLVNGGCWDKPTVTSLKVKDSRTLSGCRFSTGWAKNQKLFFHAEFSRPFDSEEMVTDREGNVLFGRFNFKTGDREQILLKVALSAVSEEGAEANLQAELPGWDFDGCVRQADLAWNKELDKIRIDTKTPDRKKVFYTAMYHAMIHPSLFSDVNKDYRGADDRIHSGGDFDTYTVLSLWDTYRAQLPLLSILQPMRINSLVHTMLNIYNEQGRLPVWHLMGNETDCMIGNPGVIAVADAIAKRYGRFDWGKAYRAMKASALLPERGQDLRMKYGFIPADLFNESVAFDMEYAIADAAVAKTAKILLNAKDADYFTKRSHSYRHYYDPATGFFRGRNSDGSFVEPFNPYHSDHRHDVYCEGNAWQYAWLMPHDVDNLASILGSEEKICARLDSLFAAESDIEGGNASPDISGLIGQYAHGNEPSHHIIYLYTMAGQPWKTADRVREVLNTCYTAAPDGLPGNEDSGQMSAWYILSAMGFYQVEPASTRFWFGSPLFDKVRLRVPGGRFTIEARNNSDKNRYIRSITLNGKPYRLPYIEFDDIFNGGKLVLHMGPDPVKWYE